MSHGIPRQSSGHDRLPSAAATGDGLVPVTLCRVGGLTCGACCWGPDVARERLTAQLARQRRLFQPVATRPGSLSFVLLALYELRARYGVDLIWAVLLRVPLLQNALRIWLPDRLICAFAAFEDDAHTRVGCLLHPTKNGGMDLRQRAAFALLPRVGCGPATYTCDACDAFCSAPAAEREAFVSKVSALDWYEYSRATQDFPRKTISPSDPRSLKVRHILPARLPWSSRPISQGTARPRRNAPCQ